MKRRLARRSASQFPLAALFVAAVIAGVAAGVYTWTLAVAENVSWPMAFFVSVMLASMAFMFVLAGPVLAPLMGVVSAAGGFRGSGGSFGGGGASGRW